jgi:hypothetical protein
VAQKWQTGVFQSSTEWTVFGNSFMLHHPERQHAFILTPSTEICIAAADFFHTCEECRDCSDPLAQKEHKAQSAYFSEARDEEFIDRQPIMSLDAAFGMKKRERKLWERKTMMEQRAFIYSMYEHQSKPTIVCTCLLLRLFYDACLSNGYPVPIT